MKHVFWLVVLVFKIGVSLEYPTDDPYFNFNTVSEKILQNKMILRTHAHLNKMIKQELDCEIREIDKILKEVKRLEQVDKLLMKENYIYDEPTENGNFEKRSSKNPPKTKLPPQNLKISIDVKFSK